MTKRFLVCGLTFLFTSLVYADPQVIMLNIRGKVNKDIEISSEKGDKIACASSGKYGFHFWGLRKSDDYKTTFMADLNDQNPPIGKIDYSGNKNTYLTIVTRPERYFWTASNAPCSFNFKNDGANLTGTFECQDLQEYSSKLENNDENRVTISGSFSCKIMDWNY